MIHPILKKTTVEYYLQAYDSNLFLVMKSLHKKTKRYLVLIPFYIYLNLSLPICINVLNKTSYALKSDKIMNKI
ncbi:hypothetical protein BpHYR1_009893 [Brachionus plicatilis]|uniref:Uncharacterized protein n=1 Tax=Brachionus plicatilis TaxID=10195 RepID=A0A3M7QJI9_BRAPC|nr:hypothetical protein BpHYR1_009893 [Brachionus plicatilis]